MEGVATGTAEDGAGKKYMLKEFQLTERSLPNVTNQGCWRPMGQIRQPCEKHLWGKSDKSSL